MLHFLFITELISFFSVATLLVIALLFTNYIWILFEQKLSWEIFSFYAHPNIRDIFLAIDTILRTTINANKRHDFWTWMQITSNCVKINTHFRFNKRNVNFNLFQATLILPEYCHNKGTAKCIFFLFVSFLSYTFKFPIIKLKKGIFAICSFFFYSLFLYSETLLFFLLNFS